MIRAVDMNQMIRLQRATAVADGGGGRVVTWADLAATPCVWAHVRAKAGREALAEGRMNASYVVVFTIWNRCDLSEADRIVWQGESYNIRGILRTGGEALQLAIEAERGVAS